MKEFSFSRISTLESIEKGERKAGDSPVAFPPVCAQKERTIHVPPSRKRDAGKWSGRLRAGCHGNPFSFPSALSPFVPPAFRHIATGAEVSGVAVTVATRGDILIAPLSFA